MAEQTEHSSEQKWDKMDIWIVRTYFVLLTIAALWSGGIAGLIVAVCALVLGVQIGRRSWQNSNGASE